LNTSAESVKRVLTFSAFFYILNSEIGYNIKYQTSNKGENSMSHDGKDFYVVVAGFVDSNVILFVAMFIVGGALFETGMANKIGGVVTHFAKSEKQLIIAIMIITFLCTVWLQASAGAQGRRGWNL
jgi:di/tricarboxylate transporter